MASLDYFLDAPYPQILHVLAFEIAVAGEHEGNRLNLAPHRAKPDDDEMGHNRFQLLGQYEAILPRCVYYSLESVPRRSLSPRQL